MKVADINATAVADLRQRNTELEREVAERKEREERLRQELERSRERLAVLEEAEDRLCGELTELEADAVETVREYNLHIKYLVDQLVAARQILSAAGVPHNTAAVSGARR